MPANPTTGVDPVADRFVIWRESTQQYTNMNATWPRVDGGPIEGGNPDYQYFKKVAGSPPDVDHRFTLTTAFAKVEAAQTPPAGHPAGTYEPQFVLTKLTADELKAQVETEFQRQVSLIIPATHIPSELAATLDAVIRKQDGAVLTDKQDGKRVAVKSIGEKLTQLEARKDELFTAIDFDQDYDITVWPAV
jgi:hypothetical protein